MVQKVALVTGAAAGIGAECSRRLAKDGIPVGVLDLNGDGAEQVAAEIRAAGGRAIGLAANVADMAQMQAAVDKVVAEFGPITILVNNAGISNFHALDDITDELWDQMFLINAKAPFKLIQMTVKGMRDAGWGRIVNITSSSVQSGSHEQIHYAASKGAVHSMTRSLAQALGKHGITVNNIPPGSVMQTIMSEANISRFQVPPEKLAESLPVRRLGVPLDIANACAWLCHEDTGYVTGQTIGVNGGRVMAAG